MGKHLEMNEMDIKHTLQFFICYDVCPNDSMEELSGNICILFPFTITLIMRNNAIPFSQNEEIMRSLRNTLR